MLRSLTFPARLSVRVSCNHTIRRLNMYRLKTTTDPGRPALLARCARDAEIERLKASGAYPFFPTFGRTDGPTVRHGDRMILHFGSNNYQGLTADPRVRAAASAALE